MYDLHVKKQDENEKWSKLLQNQKEFLEKMSHLESRVTKALANLTAGVDARCPRIVCIVPLNEKGVPILKWPKLWINT